MASFWVTRCLLAALGSTRLQDFETSSFGSTSLRVYETTSIKDFETEPQCGYSLRSGLQDKKSTSQQVYRSTSLCRPCRAQRIFFIFTGA